MAECECGGDFKKCRMRFPIGDEVADRGQSVSNSRFGNHFAIYSNAFAKGNEVRGREEPGPTTLCAQN